MDPQGGETFCNTERKHRKQRSQAEMLLVVKVPNQSSSLYPDSKINRGPLAVFYVGRPCSCSKIKHSRFIIRSCEGKQPACVSHELNLA